MTREEMEELKGFAASMGLYDDKNPSRRAVILGKAIKALDQEPLTDTEKRIFLAAMGREEKICREVCADGDGVDLVMVCRSIERKVKKALWE